MPAVTIRAHRGPEQIYLADLPRPSAPGPRDVVVAPRAAALLGEGVLHPVVDTVLRVGEARAACERMASGRRFGRVVLDIAA
jgi:NADPH:quinone reductase-like Zn-dependent oxidoreductase